MLCVLSIHRHPHRHRRDDDRRRHLGQCREREHPPTRLTDSPARRPSRGCHGQSRRARPRPADAVVAPATGCGRRATDWSPPASIATRHRRSPPALIGGNRDLHRVDTALTVAQVDVETWRLTLDGAVDRPRHWTFDDLLARGLVERDITLNCVSNEVGGPYVGTAR
ncbi:molybdopterin-dependent oxidoreductase [Micromonospora ureilytica]|uniref:molybdopterin-dependent oxidoreductase n=1 Tax=Micromonospora ureilytica TaxID=709868 RepID=UPI003990911B